MKRSRAVPLTLVATATALAACGEQEESLACVDKNTNRVVAEALCASTNAPTVQTPAPGGAGGVTSSAGGIPPIFLWYYGGRMLSGIAQGGGYAPIGGRSYRSPGGLAFNRNQGWSRGRAGGNGVFGSRARAGGSSRGGFGGIGAGRGVGG